MRLNLISLVILAFSSLPTLAQFSVSGTLSSPDGQPIFNASVGVLNTFRGNYSDENGEFKIDNLPPGQYQLKVSFVGYKELIKDFKLTKDIKLSLTLEPSAVLTNEVVVSATQAEDKTPVAFTNVSKEELEKNNNGQDIPYLLRLTPSVVTTSDAGAGVGYTGMRIRGSDATRTNVTVNGIPLNDPESQGVWWVNMPDFASSADNIQIQRGVGTSTIGAGAFGGSINIQTNELKQDAYGEIALSGGSFNTSKASASFGTGLLNKHWSVDGRLSQIASDGYIDRASSQLQSYYFSGSYIDSTSSVRLITFSGKEKTYQAWNGIPSQYLVNNRTFNPYDYENEIDNYQQSHYQLLMNKKLGKMFSLSLNGHYTKGGGYFEQYKGDQYNKLLNFGAKEDLADYGISPVINGTDTITQSNIIRRKWLDNDFYGAVFALKYDEGKNVVLTLGGAYNQYVGQHFGEVIWAEYAGNSQIRHKYYDNEATKNDLSTYLKINNQLNEKWNLYLDIQYRNVFYKFTGIDEFGNPLPQEDKLDFFNPKAGLTYRLNSRNEFYGSLAVANKEPNRVDYVENTIDNRPNSEQMYDYELGYTLKGNKVHFNTNLYYMHYNNQLIMTGEYNDVGAAKRVNVESSYRTGIELSAAWKISELFDWQANLTLSQNKIADFTEHKDDWSTGTQIQTVHQNTDISFSPNYIAGQEFVFHAVNNQGERIKNNLDFALLAKLVGAQYLDNTGNAHRQLSEYSIFDFRTEYKVQMKSLREIGFNFTIHNLMDREYVSNAWTYAFSSPGYDPTPDDPYVNSEGGDNYNMTGNMPNAKRYFMLGLRIKL